MLTPGGCQGTTGCGHFCPLSSLPFLAARAGPRLGHLPFLTAPLPVSSLPTEAPGSEGLTFSLRWSLTGPSVWEELGGGNAGMGRALRPSASILQGHRAHPGFSRRHIWPSCCSEAQSRAGSKPKFAPFWMGTGSLPSPFIPVHERGTAAPFPLLFPFFLSNFGPLQGPPWERGQDGRIEDAVGCGLRGWAREVWALLHPMSLGTRTACEQGRAVCRVASDAPSALRPPSLWYSADKAPRFSAVVNSVFHTKSLIVESLCLPPPFSCLDSSNLIILPSPVS